MRCRCGHGLQNVLRGERLIRESTRNWSLDIGRGAQDVGPALRHRERESRREADRGGWNRCAQTRSWLASAQQDQVTLLATIWGRWRWDGACTAAFRLIDACCCCGHLVANAERLHVIAFEGTGPNGKMTYDSCSYPMFRQMRADVKEQAELIVVSVFRPAGFDARVRTRKWKGIACTVSGWMFRRALACSLSSGAVVLGRR
jgi:hypothetical protein